MFSEVHNMNLAYMVRYRKLCLLNDVESTGEAS